MDNQSKPADKLIWLVEEYDNYVKELVDEIKRQGQDVEFIDYHKMQQDSGYTGVGLPQGCGNFTTNNVLFYGSIQTAQHLLRHKPEWLPCVWYNFQAYHCSKYYAKLGHYLLNGGNYIMLPRDEVKRRFDHLVGTMGWNESLFIRPDSGTKSFGGQVIDVYDFEKEWRRIEQSTEPDSLCVVATPRKIDVEWRFVVADGQVITGSQYKLNGSAEIVAGAPPEAFRLAQVIADEKYNPDPMYTIDLCLADGDIHLMEIGCFSCAGLYACDLFVIVQKASELAVCDYKEMFI